MRTKLAISLLAVGVVCCAVAIFAVGRQHLALVRAWNAHRDYFHRTCITTGLGFEGGSSNIEVHVPCHTTTPRGDSLPPVRVWRPSPSPSRS